MAQWGQERDSYINFEKVSPYIHILTTNGEHVLSSQTITDIDFERLFAFVDRTQSKIGQQYLYDHL